MPTESIEDQLLNQPPLFADTTVVCPVCHGDKVIRRPWGEGNCSLCHGKGRVSDILAGQWERIGQD